MVVYFIVLWNILRSFGIFYGHLYIVLQFGILRQEKSGNPVLEHLSAMNLRGKKTLEKNLRSKQLERAML
jgi:hypothetical protein